MPRSSARVATSIRVPIPDRGFCPFAAGNRVGRTPTTSGFGYSSHCSYHGEDGATGRKFADFSLEIMRSTEFTIQNALKIKALQANSLRSGTGN